MIESLSLGSFSEIAESKSEVSLQELEMADSVLEKMNDMDLGFDDEHISDVGNEFSKSSPDVSQDDILERMNDFDGIEETEGTELEDDVARDLSPESVLDRINQSLTENMESANEGLTSEEKEKIKEETGWSDEIIDAIKSMDEYKIYKEAVLKEAEIGEKKCLIRDDIDWDQKIGAMTNKMRAEKGLSPINKDGKIIELHHIGQHSDSPLAELTTEEHRGTGNDAVLHDKNKESEIDRNVFGKERAAHWEARAKQGDEE